MWWSAIEVRIFRAFCAAIEAEPDCEDPEVCRTLRELNDALDECARLRARHLN